MEENLSKSPLFTHVHDQGPTLQNNVIPKDFWKVVCFFLEAFFLAARMARIKDQQDKSHNKQTNNLSKSLMIPLSKLLTYLLYSKPSRSPTVFSKCHPKSSSSSLKLISNEMVLAVSIANQIVVFTSQILRDMAITLTPNSHTHPKPKQFFSFSESKQRFHQFSVSFCWTCMAYFEF